MPRSPEAFERLVAPIAPEAFFREIWEREPLIVHREHADYYDDLFSMTALAEMLYLTRPKFDGLRTNATPTDMLRGIFPEDSQLFFMDNNSIGALSDEYARGKSINVMKLEQRWLPVGRLCRELEEFFRYPITATSFLTPSGAQGLDVHFDGTDGFILQIAGTKHWRLYRPIDELPLREWVGQFGKDDIGEPTHEIVLRPGDFMYLPRGWLHEAFAGQSSSLHITIAVSVVRWVEVIKAALMQFARRDLRLRLGLPIGLLGTGKIEGDVKNIFDELINEISSNLVMGEGINELEDAFIGELPVLPCRQFTPIEDIAAIAPTTRMKKALGMICRVFNEGGATKIQFPGGLIAGPEHLKPAFDFIAETRSFYVHELPGTLSINSKLVLVRRLVRDRLLTRADEECATGHGAADRATG